MKERPILFSGPMVRAILDGSKTQTRRIVKFPFRYPSKPIYPTYPAWENKWMNGFLRPPYGKPGDRLWVRESYFQFGHWEPVPGVTTRKTGRQKWRFVPDSDEIRYADDPPAAYRKGMHKETPDYRFWHKRLARFMPRAYARILLKIVDIRVERLNEISEADAMAEGWSNDSVDPLVWFCALWTKINGPGSWTANPWVWVVEFKKVTP